MSLRLALFELKRKVAHRRVVATGFVLASVATLITKVRPRERWYWDTYSLSQLLARVIRRIRPGMVDPSLESRLLHRFLDIMADRGRRFPIPVRVEGREVLEEIAARPGGFVCCTAHLPFVKLLIVAGRDILGPGVEIVTLAKYAGPDSYIPLWCSEPVRAISIGPDVLLQTRSLLRRGGCLMLLTDKEQGEYMSANIFRFVGKVGSRILMGFPLLQPDGVILLRILEAPAPDCRDEAGIRANLDFIAENVRAILTGGVPPEKVRASVMPGAELNSGERSRESDRIQLYSRSQLEARTRRMKQLLAGDDVLVTDRRLYEQRLKALQDELDLRMTTVSRSEYAEDGTPLY